MRKLIAILILAMAAICGYAQQKQAIIKFQEMEYEFGDIAELGGVVTHRFVYENLGNIPLILNSVHTSCGCTSPAWSKEPVAPQKSGYIDVTFDPRDRPGSFAKSIIVSSNAQEKSVTLYISGTVEPRPEPLASQYPYSMFDLRLKATTINFNNIAESDVVSHDIEILNPTKANIVIEPDRKNIPEYIKVEPNPSILPPGERGYIRVTFNAAQSKLFDYVDQKIPLMVNTYLYYLHLKATISEEFSDEQKANAPELSIINADELNLGDLREGETGFVRLKYRNEGRSDLKIRAIRNLCDCISYKVITPEVAPGMEGEIHVFLNTEGRSGAQTKYLTLVTNSATKRLVVCKITANIRK